MQNAAETLEYDVVIVGAGPAGCTCALALKDAGLRVALIDKASFPRDKVCGDAIPARAIKALQRIDPAFAATFSSFPRKCTTKHTALFYGKHQLMFDWVLDAFTCTRMEFDNFLFSLVKKYTDTDVYTDAKLRTIVADDNVVSMITDGANKLFNARIVIGTDGAHSVVAKQLAGRAVDRKHHVAAVRSYFENVAGISYDTIEMYFNKRFMPSYLWVFPIGQGRANVGIGMLSSEIAKRKVNLKQTFYEFMDRTPALKAKLGNAMQTGALEGFDLPLGSRIGAMSGANFMLAGDAASLIDPITGEGIGNAMLSGNLTAQQAIQCFQQDNFSGAFMKHYDRAVLTAIGPELRNHYRAQRVLSALPSVLDVVFLAGKNRIMRRMLKAMM